MFKYSLLLLVSLLSGFVQAASWENAGKVTRVHSGHGNGIIYFTTEKQISNPDCQSNAGYTLKDNVTNTDRIYSLLLSAYVSKNPVSIYVTGTCFSGRPEVNAVQFRDEGVAF